MITTAAGFQGHATVVHASEASTSPMRSSQTDVSSARGTISISVTAGSYKSIKPPLEWCDIPSLAILTGVNGSGKSQLLEAIELSFHPRKRKQRENSNVQVTVTGSGYRAHEVLLLQNLSKARSAQSGYNQLESNIESARQTSGDNPFETAVSDRLKALHSGADATLFSNEFLDLFYANAELIERAIVNHFAAYIIGFANCLLGDSTLNHEACRRKLGLAPWDELNEVLELAAFPYRFIGPTSLSVGQSVALRLRYVGTGEEIDIKDLSGGEATIIRFLLFNFAATRESFSLKLLLLDEPDAHLHTSLIHTFLNVVRELVQRHDLRVIMSTHRIETIALAPEESLYVMHRDAPRVRKSDGTTRTIAMLTSNIVGIRLAGKRPVIVEDIPDSEFYRTAVEILQDERHWGAPVVPDFIPSSDVAPKGGKGPVKNAVQALRKAGDDVLRGLIDRDYANQPEEGIIVLDRYAIENYLLDPINVFVFLLDIGQAPALSLSEPLRLGEEGKIRSRSEVELQEVADAVLNLFEANMQPELPGEGTRRDVTIEYTNGKSIRVPRWLIERRGHDLMQTLRIIVGSPRPNAKDLTKSMLKVRMIAVSLRRILLEAAGVNH